MDSFRDALTTVQREILDALKDAPPFYLTGGAALASSYLGHRQSLDLDLFVVDALDLEALAAFLQRTCVQRGWAVEEVRVYPGFRRYLVRSVAGSSLVDLVHETAAQMVPMAAKPVRDGVRVDAVQDLVANKLCAILGRSEVKDLVDLYFLAGSGIDVLASLDDARRKDAGLDPATLAWVLRQTPTDPEGLMLLRPVTAEQVSRFRDQLVERLAAMAWPRGET